MENGNESCCTEAYGQCQGPRMMASSCWGSFSLWHEFSSHFPANHPLIEGCFAAVRTPLGSSGRTVSKPASNCSRKWRELAKKVVFCLIFSKHISFLLNISLKQLSISHVKVAITIIRLLWARSSSDTKRESLSVKAAFPLKFDSVWVEASSSILSNWKEPGTQLHCVLILYFLARKSYLLPWKPYKLPFHS